MKVPALIVVAPVWLPPPFHVSVPLPTLVSTVLEPLALSVELVLLEIVPLKVVVLFSAPME